MLTHIIVKGKYIQAKGLRYGFPFWRKNLGSWGGEFTVVKNRDYLQGIVRDDQTFLGAKQP